MAARFAGRLARSLVLLLYVVPAAAVAQSAGPHMYPPTAQQQAETRARAGSHPNPDEVCPTMVKFMAPLQQEYPKENFGSMQEGKLQTIEIPLFAEANFEPIFGKAYRQMSRDEIQEIFHKYIVPCGNPKWGIVSSLQEAFMGRSSQAPLAHEKLVPALAALHDARVKINTTGRMLESLPNDPASYDTAKAAPATVTEELKLVWPSERVKFHNALQNAEKKAATPALEAKVQKLLDGPPTLATVQRLHDVPKDFSELFTLVPSDEAKSVQQRLDARSAEIGPKLVEEQRAVMLGFDGTEDGLRKGAAWALQFQTLYANHLRIAGADQLASEYYDRRDKQLATREPEIRHRIDTASDEFALEPILPTQFPLPVDRQSPEYARLQTAAEARLQYLQKKAAQQAEALQREEERREAADAKAHGLGGGNGHAASAAVMNRAKLSPNAFTAKGIVNESTMMAMFNGEFEKINFAANDIQFTMMLEGYLEGFADHCAKYLPTNKVMMMKQVCDGYSHMVNGYGAQVTNDICDSWEWKPTGKYADPVLYDADKNLSGVSDLKSAFSMMKNVTAMMNTNASFGDIFGAAVTPYMQAGTLKGNAALVIELNGCTSPGLRRFQDNMLLFAEGKPLIRLDGTSSAVSTGGGARAIANPNAGIAIRGTDADYVKLLDNMLELQFKASSLTQYINGSVTAVKVLARDTTGHPVKVQGMYEYAGSDGAHEKQWVRLEFSDNVPKCLYFQNEDSVCEKPDELEVVRYKNGAYGP